MARRAPARKTKKASTPSNVKPKGKSKSRRSTASKDVFSDDEEEAAHQERTMNARADVDEVFEYEEPTFEQEDSEVDEDEAFNSEDEAAYGILSTVSDDEEEDEEKIKNLRKMVDGLVEQKNKKKLTEIDSQFATEAGDGQLTLGSLLGTQTLKPGAEAAENEEADEKTQTGLDLRRVRQQVRELDGDGTTLTLQTNREPVHDARAQRKLAYVEKSKEVDIFEPVVRRNRNKETLDLRVQAPKLEKLTPAVLTSKFVAQTDMEKSVAALLLAGDLSDKKLAKDEEEELARKHVSMEEVAGRQKELAKLRSLLFYEEQKKKRVKKIKSKLYHKIRNAQDKKAMTKQKEQLRALDPELARKLDEELAEKRAEERLTLKHRNTSKWVKHQLRRGIQADDATRSAIADQLRRGEELRRKMDAVDSDDEFDDEDDEDEEGDAASRLQKRLEKQANTLVTEIDADSAEAGKKRGLQGMKFMQRAAEKQREKARVEAEKLLREIRTGDGADGDRILSEGEDYLSSGDEGVVAKKNKKAKKAKKKVVVTEQDKATVDRALAGGALQTANVSMSGGVSARASGAIAIDLGEGGSGVALANDEQKQKKDLELGAKSLTQKSSAVAEPQLTDTEDADMEPAAEGENPWLSSTATKSKSRSKKNKKKTQQKKGSQPDVAAAIESLAQDTKETNQDDSAIATLTNGATKNGKKRKVDATTTNAVTEQVSTGSKKKNKKAKKEAKAAGQDELVRRAFEFVADEEDELAQEKDRLAGQDADAKKGAEIAKLVGMSGWGSWAGDGVRVSKRQIAREQKAKDIAREAKQKALAGRKDARLERVLINEKKDKKAAKYMVKDVPYPFTSREEYEAAMRNPLGSDWNTSQVTNVLTAPKIMKHAGTAIAPLVLSKDDRKQAKKELSLKRKAKF
ncbi:U3 small nucleolar RNA-associated protein [Phytophthora megakarya]|uniref:U3 small nucleolar RNA-associated protein n=1 Tax=Phytophthora megakarya TaxID=4795 RepID=A0A225WXS1_9STRA|nr:U3 small nucleolar RNA-associated protein [Phytophthora megakarya]